jgi:chemotaxis protein histidine kinase CheA
MLMYQDPSMKEIVDDFCKEGRKQISQLNDHLFNLEDDLSDLSELEAFGQVIDRMMGAAKSLEINSMATFCELGKAIGYKASQVNEAGLISIVVAVLIDAVEILDTLLGKLEKGEVLELKEISTDAFISRLQWLNDKFKHIKRASVAIGDVAQTNSNKVENLQDNIDDLLKQLGL